MCTVQEKISSNGFTEYFSLPQQWKKKLVLSLYTYMLNSRTIYFAVPELHELNFVIVSFQMSYSSYLAQIILTIIILEMASRKICKV